MAKKIKEAPAEQEKQVKTHREVKTPTDFPAYKRVYSYTDEGYYCGTTKAYQSPEEPGVYHIPRNATETAPGEIPSGKLAKYVPAVEGFELDGWEFVDRPEPVEKERPKPDPKLIRDSLLRASDWTQLPDAPLNDAAKQAWKEYRQALRDLPASKGWPDKITWPENP